MTLTIDLAVAKTHRAGNRESGDTVELVERPGGGISVVLVDAQGSGNAAKLLSLQVAGHVLALLNQGVRDGAAARAAHDFLFTLRGGRVSAELDIVSVDLASRTLVITRNSEAPLLLRRNGGFEVVASTGGRIGLYRHTRPSVSEWPLEPGLTVIVVSDGVAHAGQRWQQPVDLVSLLTCTLAGEPSAQELADSLLAAAIAADRGHPQDDMTVVALRLSAGGSPQPIRRLALTVPLSE
ncbi:PP2C family protein-serine/threonine phosphatase [Thermomicrobium sp. 4228-Ro]|uniref:PP2C family protein-serine/threonine phosphatase n=1 Tax=Thermomicrobium sp. 4228-Ro TaxID=2993937 RepID=UPI002248F496|nr:PP2C family protein-serine/threonine phosphatase [Thermomicrobium sp. 4228-Ro]MCX2727344.1 PP2C family protein-serine/threonine phosphatase [Thermomicrobium sp. 4228-Ro]